MDTGDDYRARKAYWKERKQREGIDCPDCLRILPRRFPSRLLPGWTCRVCGFTRPEIVHGSESTKGGE